MYVYNIYTSFILDLYIFVPCGYVSASYYPTSGMKHLTNDNWIAVLDMLWTAMKSALESLQSGHVQTDWWDTATVNRHQDRHQVGSEMASLVKFCDISWCFVIQCRQATREFERRSLQRVKSIEESGCISSDCSITNLIPWLFERTLVVSNSNLHSRPKFLADFERPS